MSDDHRTSVFCPSCGEVLTEASQRLEDLQSTVSSMGVTMARQQAQIARMRKVQASENPEEFAKAMLVAEYWRDMLHPGARELNGPRLQHTIARLRAGYTIEELQLSIWGYYCRPNIYRGRHVRHDQGGDRKVDLEYIMRDGPHVDVGLQIAKEEMRFDQEALNDGASRRTAERCNCGHGRGDHGLFRVNEHEACHVQGCECNQFDDSDWRFDQWAKERNLRAKRVQERSMSEQFRSMERVDSYPPVETPTQGSLL